MTAKRNRPLSPHLFHWRWQIHAIVSILHRATGDGMALVGIPLFLWWLASLASGPAAYSAFLRFAGSPLGYLLGIGLTFGLFQHLASGVRHFFMDIGAGYELRTARRSSIATLCFSLVMTALFWAYLLLVKP
ncbi:succinate dehydrogenase, cytochrome b556 subunit [Sphingomonas sp. YL-JM2C]